MHTLQLLTRSCLHSSSHASEGRIRAFSSISSLYYMPSHDHADLPIDRNMEGGKRATRTCDGTKRDHGTLFIARSSCVQHSAGTSQVVSKVRVGCPTNRSPYSLVSPMGIPLPLTTISTPVIKSERGESREATQVAYCCKKKTHC